MAGRALGLTVLIASVASAGCAGTATSPSDGAALTLHVSSAQAETVRPADGAARIDYTLCYAIGLANVVRRPVTVQAIAFSVVRADGSSFASSGGSYPAGQRIGGGASNGLYGCPVVFQEPDTGAPTATSYRMSVEYTFDIGGASSPHVVTAEGTFVATAR